MNNNKSFLGRIDWLTILLWLSLCIIGWFNIKAAVFDPEHPSLFNLSTNYGKQGLFIFLGLLVGFSILIIDQRFYTTIAPVVYLVVMVLLIIVLFVGKNVGGNQSWIDLGFFRLQPSEFAKLAACLLLSTFLNSQANKPPLFKNLLIAAGIIMLPVALVMLQPDTGSAMVFSSLVFVFYREGYVGTSFLVIVAWSVLLFVLALLIPNEWILIGILALIAGIFAYLNRTKRKLWTTIIAVFLASSVYVLLVDFAYYQILRPHQRGRIEVILGRLNDPRGLEYNLNQSKIAIGSGQLFGKGYMQGTQTKYNFVPEQSTDFIFCTVGEEWGFVGSTFVVCIYLFLLLRIINIAERQRTTFARVYGYGVASILFFHFFINLGMIMGLIPIIGIPLPFLSYGGSSLLSFTILLYILLKFDSSRKGPALI